MSIPQAHLLTVALFRRSVGLLQISFIMQKNSHVDNDYIIHKTKQQKQQKNMITSSTHRNPVHVS